MSFPARHLRKWFGLTPICDKVDDLLREFKAETQEVVDELQSLSDKIKDWKEKKDGGKEEEKE